jgi:hypothetical protein
MGVVNDKTPCTVLPWHCRNAIGAEVHDQDFTRVNLAEIIGFVRA